MKFVNRTKSTKVFDLINNSPDIKRKLKHLPKGTMVLVYDDVAELDRKLKHLIVKNKIYFIFNKDNNLFFGPYLDSIHDACYYCLLLSLSVDLEQSNSLKRRSNYRFLLKSIEANLDISINKVTIYNLEDKSNKYLKKPLLHPACGHYYGESLNGEEKIGTVSSIIKEVYDEYTGLIRKFILLNEIVPGDLKKIFSRNYVYLSWFENPVFPIYPEVQFLDLSIGSDVNKKASFRKAIFESLERFSVLSMPYSEPDFIGRFDAKNSHMISPLKFWKYSREQIKSKDFLFKNFSKNTKLNWRTVSSPVSSSKIIPEDFLYINLPKPSIYQNNSTSGCAAQETLSEARLNALLELIERDNTMIHWAEQRIMPQLDLSTLGYLRSDVDFIQSLGYEIKIINCSRFPNVYTFITLLINREFARPCFIVTSACHFMPDVAIGKSINEAIGSLLISIFMEDKNGVKKLNKGSVVDPQDHAIYYRNKNKISLLKNFIQYSTTQDLNDLDVKYSLKNPNLLKEILVDIKEYDNTDVYFYDLTHPAISDTGVKVARAFSPNLMPISFGTGQLRLGGNDLNKIKYTKRALNFPHPYS